MRIRSWAVKSTADRSDLQYGIVGLYPVEKQFIICTIYSRFRGISSAEMDVVLETFEDGHKPGGTSLQGQLAHYRRKNSANCFAIFDDLLSDEWCDRAYEYALKKDRPWGRMRMNSTEVFTRFDSFFLSPSCSLSPRVGAYVTTADAQDEKIDADDLWRSGEAERAIGLAAVRALLFSRGAGLIGSDGSHIHGNPLLNPLFLLLPQLLHLLRHFPVVPTTINDVFSLLVRYGGMVLIIKECR